MLRRSGPGQGTSQVAARLIELADEESDFFLFEDQAFASVNHRGGCQTWAVKSPAFRGLLSQRLWEAHHTTAGDTVIAAAIRVIEARTREIGRTEQVFLRLAQGGNGTIYIDLVDDGGQIVEVSTSGWGIVPSAPVHFIRKPGMQALPVPTPGGSLEDLRAFLNVDDEGFMLVMAWLIGSLCSWGPYWILDLAGEQGSAKSTSMAVLQRLLDPNRGRGSSMPSSVRDLAIYAQNARLMAFDNTSYVRPDVSDGLCRVATGGGLRTRALYTDADEVILEACRPIAMNGIEELGSRPDLLNRTLLVYLKPIRAENRKDEKSFWQEFDHSAPRTFGAVLDAVSLSLRDHESMNPGSLERMADAMKWALAAAPAFGGRKALRFALQENTARTNALAVESSPIVGAMVQLLERENGPWEGNAQSLLNELTNIVVYSDRGHPRRGWPETPKGLSNTLRRILPALRSLGILSNFQEHGRLWTFWNEDDIGDDEDE